MGEPSGRDRRRAFEPPQDREVFVVPLVIAPEDIDDNRHVNNVVYVRWLQDVGTAHWNARFDAATRARWSWVCLRHEVDYRRPLELGDAVQARTWVGVPQGPRFARFVLIEGPGGIAAQGLSEWALVDAASMRPHRIPPEMIVAFQPHDA
ncbi:MAG: acyl-CoA thioesterase [Caulobacteraceae bacterium]|nr:acyl-CoA thioesterase [Caulobacteraceae bacterium]